VVLADFKSVQKKFVDQGIDEPLVKDYFEKFKALRDKNKLSGNEKNIDLWAKKSFEEFKNKLDELSKEKTKTAKKKEARTEGAKLIAENEGWRVYEISNHKAAMLYGSDTKWCITQADGEDYNNHSDTNNIYYLLSKTLNTRENTWAKVALLVDSAGKKTYWDVLDKDHESVPKELKIPKFKVEKAVHLVTIDGKKYDVNNLPENLKVSGRLSLYRTPITSLPKGLEVGGSLDLSYTKITSLPAGLKIGGYLDLNNTPITSLPDDLKVQDGIYVNYSAKIQCSDELRKKLRK